MFNSVGQTEAFRKPQETLDGRDMKEKGGVTSKTWGEINNGRVGRPGEGDALWIRG